MQSSRLSTEAQLDLPDPALGTKAHVGVADTKRTRKRAPTVWLCWEKKKQCGRRRVGEQVSATTRVVAAQ